MFKTSIKIEPNTDFFIDYNQSGFSLGSCFANNIGVRLSNAKFQPIVNPFGVIYNPVSISKLLEIISQKQEFPAALYNEKNGIWSHYFLHSEHSNLKLEQLKKDINRLTTNLQNQIAHTDYVIITLGTSFVYELAETSTIVANCHKQPAQLFRKRMLSQAEITSSLANIQSYFSKNTKFIYTVSPVRHIKEGLPENMLSKSLLRIAVDEHVSKHSNATYFPAYEIMLDDLRDYRFYKDDFIHPNNLAQEYIWKLFTENYMTTDTQAQLFDIQKLVVASQHKAFHIKSDGHQTFLKSTIQKMKDMKDIDFSNEIQSLENQIIKTK